MIASEVPANKGHKQKVNHSESKQRIMWVALKIMHMNVLIFHGTVLAARSRQDKLVLSPGHACSVMEYVCVACCGWVIVYAHSVFRTCYAVSVGEWSCQGEWGPGWPCPGSSEGVRSALSPQSRDGQRGNCDWFHIPIWHHGKPCMSFRRRTFRLFILCCLIQNLLLSSKWG